MALFSVAPLGSSGAAARRFFYGPGLNNFDKPLVKSLRLTELKSLQVRLESFNSFSHAQFFGAAAVKGVVGNPAFG